MNLKTRAAAVALPAATVTSILAGCASTTTTSHSGMTGMLSMNAPESIAQHNAFDVTFAQMMIVHH